MVGDLLMYDKDTDEPYCPECGEDLTPQETDWSDMRYCHKHMYWSPIADGCKSYIMTGLAEKPSDNLKKTKGDVE